MLGCGCGPALNGPPSSLAVWGGELCGREPRITTGRRTMSSLLLLLIPVLSLGPNKKGWALSVPWRVWRNRRFADRDRRGSVAGRPPLRRSVGEVNESKLLDASDLLRRTAAIRVSILFT